MSEELERKYLAVIQESLMEKLELREENKKLKEKLANISYKKDCELFTKKFNSSDFVVNKQNTKESLMEKLELQKKIDELEEKIFKIEHPSKFEHYRKNGRSVIIKHRYEVLKPKETDLPDINLSSMIPKNENTKVNENTKESNILDEDKKKVLLDYIDKKIAYYSESDLKKPISECMFHGRFAKELQKIRALLLFEIDTSSPWFEYHFS